MHLHVILYPFPQGVACLTRSVKGCLLPGGFPGGQLEGQAGDAQAVGAEKNGARHLRDLPFGKGSAEARIRCFHTCKPDSLNFEVPKKIWI